MWAFQASRKTETAGDALRRAEYLWKYLESEGRGVWLGKALEAAPVAGYGLFEGIPITEAHREIWLNLVAGRGADGTLLADKRRQVPVYSWVFSAPKSQSILIECHPDPDVRRIAAECRYAGLLAGFRYLEEEWAAGRRGSGRERCPISARGLIAAVFEHHSARPVEEASPFDEDESRRPIGDPQHHFHIEVANMAPGVDDKWRALWTASLDKHVQTAGAIGEAVAAAEMTRRLGVRFDEIERGPQGWRELEGIPLSARALFAKRSAQMEERFGKDIGFAQAQRLMLSLRKKKEHVSEGTARRMWGAALRRLRTPDCPAGFDRDAFRTLTGQVSWSPLASAEIEAAEVRVLDRLGRGPAKFRFEELVRHWAIVLGPRISGRAQALALAGYTQDRRRGLLRPVGTAGWQGRKRTLYTLGSLARVEASAGAAGLAAHYEASAEGRVAIGVRALGGEAQPAAEEAGVVALTRSMPGSARSARGARPPGLPGAYIDFRAPTSVALFLVGSADVACRQRILDAHARAVRATLGVLGAHYGVDLCDDRLRLLDARYTTKGDPALATRVYIPADSFVLYRAVAEGLYAAALRRELSKAGLSFERAGDRYELVGYGALRDEEGKSLLRAFSPRGAHLVCGPASPGVEASALMRLRSAFGLGPELFVPGTAHASSETPSLARLTERLFGEDGPFGRVSTFSFADVLLEISRSLPAGEEPQYLFALAHQVLVLRPDLVCRLEPVSEEDLLEAYASIPLGPARIARSARGAADPGVRYALSSVLVAEFAALEAATEERPSARVTPKALRAAIARAESKIGAPLADEQRSALVSIATDAKPVSVLVGVAGAGKTTLLAALSDAYKRSGYEVLGVAHTNAATSTLESAGVTSRTVDSLLYAVDLGVPEAIPTASSVLIVDEASQLDSMRFARLLSLARGASAKLVVVGDHRQLGAVEAGGLFEELVHRVGASVLAENRRQRDPREREALAHLRQGWAEAVVNSYVDAGALHVAKSHASMLEGALDEFVARRSEGADAALLSLRSADVSALNDLAHARLVEAGLVSEEALLVLSPGRIAGEAERVTFRAKARLATCTLSRKLVLGGLDLPRGTTVTIEARRDCAVVASEHGVVRLGYGALRQLGWRVPEGHGALRVASRFGSNAEEIPAANGSVGVLEASVAGMVAIRMGDRLVHMAADSAQELLDYAYAWSFARSQSQTIGSADTKGYAIICSAEEMSAADAYVGLSRARDGTSLWATTENQATTGWARYWQRPIDEIAREIISDAASWRDGDEAGEARATPGDRGPLRLARALGLTGDSDTGAGLAALREMARGGLAGREGARLWSTAAAVAEALQVEDVVARMAGLLGPRSESSRERSALGELRLAGEARRLAKELGVDGAKAAAALWREATASGRLPGADRAMREEAIAVKESEAARARADASVAEANLARIQALSALAEVLHGQVPPLMRRQAARLSGALQAEEERALGAEALAKVLRVESHAIEALGRAAERGVALDRRFAAERLLVAKRAERIARAMAGAPEAPEGVATRSFSVGIVSSLLDEDTAPSDAEVVSDLAGVASGAAVGLDIEGRLSFARERSSVGTQQAEASSRRQVPTGRGGIGRDGSAALPLAALDAGGLVASGGGASALRMAGGSHGAGETLASPESLAATRLATVVREALDAGAGIDAALASALSAEPLAAEVAAEAFESLDALERAIRDVIVSGGSGSSPSDDLAPAREPHLSDADIARYESMADASDADEYPPGTWEAAERSVLAGEEGEGAPQSAQYESAEELEAWLHEDVSAPSSPPATYGHEVTEALGILGDVVVGLDPERRGAGAAHLVEKMRREAPGAHAALGREIGSDEEIAALIEERAEGVTTKPGASGPAAYARALSVLADVVRREGGAVAGRGGDTSDLAPIAGGSPGAASGGDEASAFAEAVSRALDTISESERSYVTARLGLTAGHSLPARGAAEALGIDAERLSHYEGTDGPVRTFRRALAPAAYVEDTYASVLDTGTARGVTLGGIHELALIFATERALPPEAAVDVAIGLARAHDPLGTERALAEGPVHIRGADTVAWLDEQVAHQVAVDSALGPRDPDRSIPPPAPGRTHDLGTGLGM